MGIVDLIFKVVLGVVGLLIAGWSFKYNKRSHAMQLINFFTTNFNDTIFKTRKDTQQIEYKGNLVFKRLIMFIQDPATCDKKFENHNPRSNLRYASEHVYKILGSQINSLVNQLNIIYKFLNDKKYLFPQIHMDGAEIPTNDLDIIKELFTKSISKQFLFLVVILRHNFKNDNTIEKNKQALEYQQLITNVGLNKDNISMFENFYPSMDVAYATYLENIVKNVVN